MLLLLFSIIFETENNYFDVACFAVHHCVALFCFQKQQKQHLKIIEQGVSNKKYVFVFTEDKTCKTGLFSIKRLKLTFTSSEQTELTSESRVTEQSQLSKLGGKQVQWPALAPQS